MAKKLPVIYLKGFLVLVTVGLILGSYAFWLDFFGISSRLSAWLPSGSQIGIKPQEPEVNLSFNSKTDSFIVNEESEIEVIINPGEKEVWGADLKISFDPDNLIIKGISPSDYFDDPLVLENSVFQEEKEAWFSIGSLTAGQGRGVLANLRVIPLQEGEATLSFLAETQVALKGKEEPAALDYHDFVFSVFK